MPRPREYQNAAERQEAYRARHRDREPPLQGYLAAQARTLHTELTETTRAGRSPLPAGLVARRADETMGNVIRYLRGLREGPSASDGTPSGKGGEATEHSS
jgi:hypothetical protein